MFLRLVKSSSLFMTVLFKVNVQFLWQIERNATLRYMFFTLRFRFQFSVFSSQFSVFRFPFCQRCLNFASGSAFSSQFSAFSFPFSAFRFQLSVFSFPFSVFRSQFSVFRFQFSAFRSTALAVLRQCSTWNNCLFPHEHEQHVYVAWRNSRYSACLRKRFWVYRSELLPRFG